VIEKGKSYTGDELRELAGNEGSERVWAIAFERKGEDKDIWFGLDIIPISVVNDFFRVTGIIVVCEDEGNDNWKVLGVMGQEEEDKVFYELCEDDILEVAASLDVKLTPDEMTEARSGVSDGMGNHWWNVTEDVIDEILRRRSENGGAKAAHRR